MPTASLGLLFALFVASTVSPTLPLSCLFHRVWAPFKGSEQSENKVRLTEV